jgi:hypothetical protein
VIPKIINQASPQHISPLESTPRKENEKKSIGKNGWWMTKIWKWSTMGECFPSELFFSRFF